jgi:hypothetical protein
MNRSIAISVNESLRVARALAEIWQGQILSFPFLPDSYIVLSAEANGVSVEIFPNNLELVLTENQQTVELFYDLLASQSTSTYAAIAVPTPLGKLAEVSQREGWAMISHRQGLSGGVELWIENQIMLVLLPSHCQQPIHPVASRQLCRGNAG